MYHYPYNAKEYKHISLKAPIHEEKAEPQQYDEKLDQSYSRTKRLFMDYALCNEFELFVTITFDPKKYNSMCYEEVREKLCKWFNNWHNRIQRDFKYMLIPERHLSGAWHFHGLMTIPYGLATPLQIPKRVGGEIVHVPNTKHYLSWDAFGAKFGFWSASFIKDYSKAVRYITKYISKEFISSDLLGKRLLLKSHGLNKPKLVYTTYQNIPLVGEKYQFCTVAWSDDLIVNDKVIPEARYLGLFDDDVHEFDTYCHQLSIFDKEV